MEDVICSSCNVVNGYHNNYCFHCGIHLKGTCATCNREENVTFVEAEVCQWHVLEDCEELKEKLKILTDQVRSRGLLLILGSFIVYPLITVVTHRLFQDLNMSIWIVCSLAVVFSFVLYFYFSWINKRIESIRHTLTSNFKESHSKEAELLEKVGWKILQS